MEAIKSPFKNGRSISVNWEKRNVEIKGSKGEIVFKRDDIEVPSDWSDLSLKVTASKYLYRGDSSSESEKSVKDIVERVVTTIADWGVEGGYFSSEEREEFNSFLFDLCVNQYGAFNSPVWFNVGLDKRNAGTTSCVGNYKYVPEDDMCIRDNNQYRYPQCSACFIQGVEDNMESILDLAKSEAMLFKFGSGSGTDLSPIRSNKESLSGSGKPSGPMSFLKIYDQVANVVKSGGKVRRAAKMNTLSIRHGDIMEFINAKRIEEKKARSLIKDGWDSSFNGDAYGTVAYQNENLSVRVDDEFMRQVESDGAYNTIGVKEGNVLDTLKARDVFKAVCEGTWECGDPGVQFSDTINKWHTCKGSGRINSSNPCSEYLFLDNTACNLASLNLVKFYKNGEFDIELFEKSIRIFILAQEIIVGNSSYPTELIAKNSHLYRTLGLGYANLGSLLMRMGLPYDSSSGRKVAAAITSLMTAIAYDCSAEIAERVGVAPCLDPLVSSSSKDMASMKDVILMHKNSSARLSGLRQDYAVKMSNLSDIIDFSVRMWNKNVSRGGLFRNMQVTVIAPTGTIGLMMGCDTTGIEPELALVKYKELAGKGNLVIVNKSVEDSLRVLGYNSDDIVSILKHIELKGTVEGSILRIEHLPVFDCSFKPANGNRSIHYNAHVDMMAAVQPFISGAISKTVNMPESSTVDDIWETYLRAWKNGVKCIAIYRDNSKGSQPLTTKPKGNEDKPAHKFAVRRKLPETRNSTTHKFNVGGHEGYITIGKYDDGSPGEVFIKMAKEGSTMGGLMDTIGILASMCLQHNVPVDSIVAKLRGQIFEPSGITTNELIPKASSIVDYLARHLENTGIKEDGIRVPEIVESRNSPMMEIDKMCHQCGSSNSTPTGTCRTCNNCGTSFGCS